MGLLESALVEVPTVVGWLRPVILLPASALTGLSSEQLEAITEAWFTGTVPAAGPSGQPHTEAHKTDAGTVLAITPQITDGNDILVEMALEVSERVKTSKTASGDLPILTRRTAKNTITPARPSAATKNRFTPRHKDTKKIDTEMPPKLCGLVAPCENQVFVLQGLASRSIRNGRGRARF